MSYAVWLVPVGLVMGLVGLAAFLWSMKSGQLEDLDGAAERVLLAEKTDQPLPSGVEKRGNSTGKVINHDSLR
jgi:cbb3-type cytochrome oxidase maturation protein